MKAAFILFGFFCLGLALVPGSALGAAEGMEAGVTAFRIALGVFGAYLLALPRFVATGNPDDAEYHDTAPAGAFAALIVILALAAGLRFYALGRGIWYDEMLMHVSHMHLSPLQILTTFKDANNHILYTFLARLSIDALGDTVAAIRVPAAVFGIASVAAIYGFARRVTAWPEALAAALLLALSYHHLWFSQNARGYTALLLFSLLSSSFLIDAMRSGSTKHWVAYAIAGALGAFTHLTIAFLFVGHFLFFLYRAVVNRNDGTFPFWSGIFQGFGILTLLTLVLHAVVLPDMLGGALLGSGLQGDSEWTNPLWAISELLGSLKLGFSGAGVLAAGGLVVIVGLARFARTEGAPVAFFVIPVGLAVLLMTSIGYTLFPRFFFFAMGFAIVIVIHGATAFGALAARLLLLEGPLQGWTTIAPALVLIAASAFSLPRAYYPKQSFAESIDYVEAHRGETDVVAVIGISDLPYNRYHQKSWARIDTVAELDALLAGGDRVWVLYTLPVQARTAHPELLDRLERDFTRAETFWGTLGGGEIVVSVSGAG
ncbi:glycosyltransferase family 39 protein [Defluviimonas sp. WL0050]|uniref:Glycosyltransferase family 39 protein n=1 Tax=Albidovulum litorale TaxID=2984134 RepID=A0ABT2ZL91_9RHOB|nr:glycosyltransferase family 39 protein [Defluviimonas sp. WL0050]MCV2871486.1 glycosyltransferase family 39 protein [Defluviimonas sp. WL0050]